MDILGIREVLVNKIDNKFCFWGVYILGGEVIDIK